MKFEGITSAVKLQASCTLLIFVFVVSTYKDKLMGENFFFLAAVGCGL